MTAKPPGLATWLLQRFDVHESLVGDLIEQHRRGRPARWYWHQVFVAVALAATKSLRAYKAPAVPLVFISVPMLLWALLPMDWLSTAVSLWIVVYASAGLGVVLLSLATSR